MWITLACVAYEPTSCARPGLIVDTDVRDVHTTAMIRARPLRIRALPRRATPDRFTWVSPPDPGSCAEPCETFSLTPPVHESSLSDVSSNLRGSAPSLYSRLLNERIVFLGSPSRRDRQPVVASSSSRSRTDRTPRYVKLAAGRVAGLALLHDQFIQPTCRPLSSGSPCRWGLRSPRGGGKRMGAPNAKTSPPVSSPSRGSTDSDPRQGDQRRAPPSRRDPPSKPQDLRRSRATPSATTPERGRGEDYSDRRVISKHYSYFRCGRDACFGAYFRGPSVRSMGN